MILFCQSLCPRNLSHSIKRKSPNGLHFLIPCFNFFSSSYSNTLAGQTNIPGRLENIAWSPLQPQKLPQVPVMCHAASTHVTVCGSPRKSHPGWRLEWRAPKGFLHNSTLCPIMLSKATNSSSHVCVSQHLQVFHVTKEQWTEHKPKPCPPPTHPPIQGSVKIYPL